MANTINALAAAMEPNLDTDIVNYVHAVFNQVDLNTTDWGTTNAKTIVKLQKQVRDLEIEVANLKVNI
tara:strand:- start:305 stop:508 length:204 start_codon:yes stop_codon:yes gene_type:complete